MVAIEPLHMEKVLTSLYRECLINDVSAEVTEKIVVALRLEMEGFV